jgi:hypothetical protein
MRKHRFFMILLPLFALVLIMLLGIAIAQEKEEKTKPNGKAEVVKNSPQSQAVQAVLLARNLAAYGQEHKSPESLVVAAQILLDNPTGNLEAEKKVEGGKETPAKEEPKKGAPQPVLDPSQLLETAKSMAAGNETVLALIKQVQSRVAETPRGRVPGPLKRLDSVLSHSTDVYRWTFRGGEHAAVGVVGDGDTDIDLYVYDGNGNYIGSDTDITSQCLVEWTPRWTGTFIIMVKNLGSVYSDYLIVTN